MKVTSTKGCPYGQRARMFLMKMKCNFETDTNVDECLSGTISDGDKHTIDCLEVIEAINDTSIYNQDEARKERQLKLALSFDQTILPHFYEATRDPIVRAGGYHMLMEFLFSFENELVRCGSFFGGSEPGFLDLWIYPWMARVGIWTPDFMKGEMCRLQSWRKRMKALDLVTNDVQKSSRSDMLRYARQLRQLSAGGNGHGLPRRLGSTGSISSM